MKVDSNLKSELKKYIRSEIEKSTNQKATIITPYKLNPQNLEDFAKVFPYLKNTVLKNEVDKEIIGGFIIKKGSLVFDASLNGKVNNLVRRLYESS